MNDRLKAEAIVVGLVIVGAILVSLGVTALLVWGITWAFGITFTWKLVFGAYLLSVLVKVLLGGASSGN